MTAIRILSIDGGGIRGILPARLLEELERRAGKPAAELFDLIAGTSTGGIIACGLARRLPAQQLGDLYARHGGAIFARSAAHELETGGGLWGPKYEAAPLEAMLRLVLGDAWLSEVKAPHLLVPSYCIALPRPIDAGDGLTRKTQAAFYFKSWKANGLALDPGDVRDAFDFPLWQVARATSAAPTYFPPACIASMAGEHWAMIDGGVFDNNPAASALASARRLYPEARRFLVLSLGTGARQESIDAGEASHWGLAEWAPRIVDVCMDGQSDAARYHAAQDPVATQIRFQLPVGDGPDAPAAAMDDAAPDNIVRLEALARGMIAGGATQLDALLEELVA